MAKAKTAFLFLIVEDLPYEILWRHWLEQLPTDSYTVHFHCKHPEHVQSEWVRENSIRTREGDVMTYRPDWGSVELVRAMLHLVREGLKDENVQRLCFISESCLPVVPPREAHERLEGVEHSWLDVKCRPNNGYSALHQFLPIKSGWTVHKADQWCLLLRKHAEILVRHPYAWRAFSHIKAPDEIYTPTVLYHGGALSPTATLRFGEKGRADPDLSANLVRALQDLGVKPERYEIYTDHLEMRARLERKEPATDDVMLMLQKRLASLEGSRVFYGEIESRKTTYVNWSYSCLHPTRFVWNAEIARRASAHGCLFARKFAEVEISTWKAWLAGQYIPRTPVLFCDNARDMYNRQKLTKYTDMHTPYCERLWPEQDCWQYADNRQRLQSQISRH